MVAWAIHEGTTVCVAKIDRGFEALYSNHRAIIRRGSASRAAEASEIEQVPGALHQRAEDAGIALDSDSESASEAQSAVSLDNDPRTTKP